MTIEIQQDISLKELNTLGLPVTARHFVLATTDEDVVEALEYAREKGWPVTVLGGGSNVVLSGDIEGLVLRVALGGIEVNGMQLEAGAGEDWHRVVVASIEQGLSGIENLSLIPGSVGAAPVQNIGAYGAELENVFESLSAIDRDSLAEVTFTRSDCAFGYRDSVFKRAMKDRFVITRVRLNLDRTFTPNLSYAALADAVAASGQPVTPELVSDLVSAIRRSKLPDPNVIGNVGSFFKNPVVSDALLAELRERYGTVPSWSLADEVKLSAGWLIEQCGLKGFTVGGARVSPGHALVITNTGTATSEDVLRLAEHISQAVSNRFNLRLEVEPVIIGSRQAD